MDKTTLLATINSYFGTSSNKVTKAECKTTFEDTVEYVEGIENALTSFAELTPVMESSDGYYSKDNGSFVANGVYKSGKFDITGVSSLYASSRVSGGATALAVFYNASNAYISYQNAGTNTPGYTEYDRQELVIPVGCKYVGISSFDDNAYFGKLETKISNTTNSDVNTNVGKKILWLGTSIPQQGAESNTSYPELFAEAIGATVYNESLGSSVVRASIYTGSYVGMYYIPCLFSLSQTIAEKQSILDHWSSGLNSEGIITEGGTYGWRDLLIGTPPADYTTLATAEYILATSYENKLVAKYLDTEDENFIASPDIFVFDHGFNDLNPTTIYDDTLANAIAVPTPTNDRARFCGAMNYLIEIIHTYNPRAQIVFIGHYENDVNTWVYQAQQVIAAYRKYPLLKLWEVLGISQLEVTTTGFWTNNTTWNNSGGTATVMTLKEIWMYDNLHPASLPTREHFAKKLIGLFKNI